MLADQQGRVGRVRTPAKRPVKQLLALEAWQVRRDGAPDGRLGGVGVRVGRMLCVRPGHRDGPRRVGAVRLVPLVPREPGELVADFDDAVLVRLEKEANVAVVDDRDVLVRRRLFRGELEVCVDPRLGAVGI